MTAQGNDENCNHTTHLVMIHEQLLVCEWLSKLPVEGDCEFQWFVCTFLPRSGVLHTIHASVNDCLLTSAFCCVWVLHTYLESRTHD